MCQPIGGGRLCGPGDGSRLAAPAARYGRHLSLASLGPHVEHFQSDGLEFGSIASSADGRPVGRGRKWQCAGGLDKCWRILDDSCVGPTTSGSDCVVVWMDLNSWRPPPVATASTLRQTAALTWTNVNSTVKTWLAVSSSSEGSRLVAVSADGPIYVTIKFGVKMAGVE
jgi:hypothetical protein